MVACLTSDEPFVFWTNCMRPLLWCSPGQSSRRLQTGRMNLFGGEQCSPVSLHLLLVDMTYKHQVVGLFDLENHNISWFTVSKAVLRSGNAAPTTPPFSHKYLTFSVKKQWAVSVECLALEPNWIGWRANEVEFGCAITCWAMSFSATLDTVGRILIGL